MKHAPGAAWTVRNDLVERIRGGDLRPGEKLDEARLADELNVSRNTLREAFRLLAADRYVRHEPHRGVFVRTVPVAMGAHIYQTRRFLESGALRELAIAPDTLDVAVLAAAANAVEVAEAAQMRGEFTQVGSANTEFHLALTGLGGNRVAARLLTSVMVDMRLLFLGVGSPEEVHARYVSENRRILQLVTLGEYARAAVVLETYLLGAERHLLRDDAPGQSV